METQEKYSLKENPRKNANIFSILTFSWVVPLFFKSRKTDLSLKDLFHPLPQHKAETLGNKLSKSWENQLKKAENGNKKPSLFLALASVFWKDFLTIAVSLILIEGLLKLTQPIFLRKIIQYYSDPENSDISDAYIYSAALLVVLSLNVMTIHLYMHFTYEVGMKLKVSVCSLVYRKTLKLSKNALFGTTSGHIVNMLSNDVGRLETIPFYIQNLWLGPLETIVVLFFMYEIIGISAVFGIIVMLSFVPLQIWLGKRMFVYRLKTAIRTDERIKLMNEIIQGIQVIKMYAWEKPFSKLASFCRSNELRMIRYVSYLRGVVFSFIMFTTRFSIFTSLVGYALLGNIVTAEKAFVITAYYNLLRNTMTEFFPQALSYTAEVIVSLKRIQNYLLLEEIQKESIENEKNIKVEKETSIVAENIKSRWDPTSNEYTLDDISVKIQSNSVSLIMGSVGSSKSSFLQTILDELPLENGRLKVNGTVSYASQEPWLFSGSVRQNILFGLPMNRARYNMILRICALQRDIEIWPSGDKTVVGERGQSLSGGQKARINLARAIYREADIYLLDDPLSAVDAHVSRHLFEQCIKSFLSNKIVILVTHQLQYLKDVDQIIILDHGKLMCSGSYEELENSGYDMQKLQSITSNTQDEEETEESSLIRRGSKQSRKSIRSISSLDNEDLINEEEKAEGSIGLYVYRDYWKAGGGYFITFIILLFFLMAQGFASAGDYFLSYWVQNEEGRLDILENQHENDPVKLTEYNRDVDIYIFSGIIGLTIVVALSRSFLFFNFAMRASQTLHDSMFGGIIRTTMFFFSSNPSGRILNRFSKDMGQIDEILPSTMMDFFQIFLSMVGIIAIVGVVNPIYLAPTFVLILMFYFLREFYLKTSRAIKRLEAITRSPIYSHLTASLQGLPTIRAFDAEEILIKEFDVHQDLNASAYFMFISTSRVFGFYLDFCCIFFIIFIIMSFFLFDSSGGNVGLLITQIIALAGNVQWGIRQSAELENTMTSVERVVEYTKLDSEPPLESDDSKKPPKEWPEKGHIVFDKLSMRYHPDPAANLVLKCLDVEIQPKEKIGLVGRTGAGKSSIINALFRLSYNDGSIYLDSRNTNTVGLHELRSKISIIPQEPVLFSGTLRYNLDPFDEYDDIKIWRALEEVKLKEVIQELNASLHTKISEGGSNFSVGQRQLICLARALLRENRVLVMDEATANVDTHTDTLIQSIIREKFVDCTVLTIAHRLNTIMDSDKILVMEAGKCVEYGSPFELLNKTEDPRIFYDMVNKQ